MNLFNSYVSYTSNLFNSLNHFNFNFNWLNTNEFLLRHIELFNLLNEYCMCIGVFFGVLSTCYFIICIYIISIELDKSSVSKIWIIFLLVPVWLITTNNWFLNIIGIIIFYDIISNISNILDGFLRRIVVRVSRVLQLSKKNEVRLFIILHTWMFAFILPILILLVFKSIYWFFIYMILHLISTFVNQFFNIHFTRSWNLFNSLIIVCFWYFLILLIVWKIYFLILIVILLIVFFSWNLLFLIFEKRNLLIEIFKDITRN